MKIPVTIVTGALGAGKTTFINYILTANHGLCVGVIVNEFGSIPVDSELLLTSKEKLIDLPNGCVCCMVRDDLIDASLSLLDRDIDYLVIETSGLAEVAPVALTFNSPKLIGKTELDSIVCVADADNYDLNKKNLQVTLDQLHCADIVLLNKADLIAPLRLKEIKEDIKKIIPKAVVLESVRGQVDLPAVLGVKLFHEIKDTAHSHDNSIESVSCTSGSVDADKVQAWLENLPDNIIRAKGILCIKESEPGLDDELRIAFNKVGKRFELEFTRPWEPNEKKRTFLVFIGRNLDKDGLQEKLNSCSASR